MVIKTAVKPKRASLPSRRPFASVYELVKLGLKSQGYYQQIQKYDPGYYTEKYQKRYSYKPRKRITGYALQTRGFFKKAPFSYNKFRKTHRRFCPSPYGYKFNKGYC